MITSDVSPRVAKRLPKTQAAATDAVTTARQLADAMSADPIDWSAVARLAKDLERDGCYIRRTAAELI